MHQNSLLMFTKYGACHIAPTAKVLEIGPDAFPSAYQEICGRIGKQWDTLDLYEHDLLTYTSVDQYNFPIPSELYDVVVTANVAEHVPRVWAWVRELARVVKSGGRLILVVPCSWPYHEAPYDCWRIYPEGIRALVEEVGLIPEILTFGSLEQPEFSEAIPGRSFDHQPEEYRDIVLKLAVTNNFPVEKSFDSICVARKPEAFGFEFDHLSKAAYDAALEEHARKIAPVLRRLDAALEQGASGNGDPRELAHWRTMRTLLISGLFDAEFYLERYPDIREARVDPLQHYVIHGEAEYRQPNRFFYPRYYRRLYMSGVPAEYNALQHYTEVGERSGARPNYAFDPQEYLAAYGSLGNYVDRPFFHFLKVGQERAQAAFGSVPESALIRHSPDSAD